MNNRLTWFDWTLIGFGLFLLFHMPALIDMRRTDNLRTAAEAPFLARGVKLP